MPKGTWMVSVKVNNEEVWEEFVKTGRVKGFSIEGYFTDNSIDLKRTLKRSFAQIVLRNYKRNMLF